jgi:hypothetical protein
MNVIPSAVCQRLLAREWVAKEFPEGAGDLAISFIPPF